MKVLFISSWYPSKNNPGFGVFVKEHAKAIQSADVEIIVMAILIERSKSIFQLKIDDYKDETDIRTIQVNISSRFRDLLYHLIPLQRIIAYRIYKNRISSSFSTDLVHSNVVFPAGMIGNFIAKKIHKTHIITEHWSKVSGILQKPYFSGLTKKTYKEATKILPVSEFLKNNLIELMPFLGSDKFQVVPNIIDSDTFAYKKKSSIEKEIRFCAIATWVTKKTPDKIPELFIDALSKVQQRIDKKIILTIVGGGDRVDELKNLCKLKSLNTEFTGYLSKVEIAQKLQSSDFFVHASTIETFGVVVAEALSTGTPVVCSNVGALPELIDDFNGILCDNTVENWEIAIEKAISCQFSNNEIAKKGKIRFSKKKIGITIRSIYEGT
jgi:L-malate glycosyltransferase